MVLRRHAELTEPIPAGPGRWMLGGWRLEDHNGRFLRSAQVFSGPVHAVPLEGRWVFWSPLGRVFRADSFLGTPFPHGAASGNLSACAGPISGWLYFLGTDGRVFRASADEPLRPVAELASTLVTACAPDRAGGFVVLTHRGEMHTADGHAFSPVAPGTLQGGAARQTAREPVLHPPLGRLREAAERGTHHRLAGCVNTTPWLARCPGGFFRWHRGGWWHVGPNVGERGVISADAAEVLLPHTCAGEPGGMCLLSQERDPVTIPRVLSIETVRQFDGDWVYLDFGELVAVELETGRTDVLPVEGVRRLAGLPNGVLLAGTQAAPRQGYRYQPGGAAMQPVVLPEGLDAICMLDGQHGLVSTQEQDLYRTDDGARTWTRVELEHTPGGLTCLPGRATWGAYSADLVDALELEPARPIDVSPASTPSLVCRVTGLRAEATAPASIEAERRRGRVHVRASWRVGEADLSGAGVLEGEEDPGEPHDWGPLLVSPEAALFQWTQDGEGRIVWVPRQGSPAVVLRDSEPGVVAWLGPTGEFVLESPGTVRVVTPDGRLVIAPLSSHRFPATIVHSDGSVGAGVARATHGGTVRFAESGRDVFEAGPLLPCSSDAPPAARWRVPYRGTGPIVNGLPPGAGIATIDVSASGAACLREVASFSQVLRAQDGGLVGNGEACWRVGSEPNATADAPPPVDSEQRRGEP